MHPLFFLVSRTLVNGVIRSFNSPARALGTLFFLFSQLYWVGSIVLRASSSPNASKLSLHWAHGVTDLISAAVFAFFAVSSWMWGWSLFSAPFGFQKADSDCLFTTPVDHKHILTLHLIRNTLFKVLVPIVTSAVLWRPVRALGAQIASGKVSTDSVAGVFRTAVLVYFLLMLLWTLLRFATVLSTAGTEEKKAKLRMRGGTAALLVTAATALVYLSIVYFRVRGGNVSLVTIGTVLADRRLWWLQPVGALATITAMGPVDGSLGVAGLGLLALVSLTVIGARVCYANSFRLSELGLQSIDLYEKYRNSRNKNPQDILNERAKSGAYKAKAPGLLSSWRTVGESAFVWRELVILWRTSRGATLLMLAIAAGLAGFLGTLDLGVVSHFPVPFIIVMISGTLAMGYSQQGMRDFLKRNDLVRPLPLSTGKLIRIEALARCIYGELVVLAGVVGWGVVAPWTLLTAPLLLFMGLGATFSLVAASNLACILLPDIDDPTQRGFRQMVMSMGVMLTLAIVIGAFVGLAMVTHTLWVGYLVSGFLGLILGVLCSLGAEAAYRNYIPNE